MEIFLEYILTPTTYRCTHWIIQNRRIYKWSKMLTSNYLISNPGSVEHSNAQISHWKNPPIGSTQIPLELIFSPRPDSMPKKRPKKTKSDNFDKWNNKFQHTNDPILSSDMQTSHTIVNCSYKAVWLEF